MFNDGDIVKNLEDHSERLWVVLKVSQDDIDSYSVDVEHPGYYGFGGMWYGDNPFDKKSYGKIKCLDGLFFKTSHVKSHSLLKIKEMVC